MDRGTFTTNTSVALTPLGKADPDKWYTLYADGTWGGGTLVIQITPDATDSTRYRDIPGTTLTANGGPINFQAKGEALQIKFSGGTGHSVKWDVL